jgi:hypothetical protein
VGAAFATGGGTRIDPPTLGCEVLVAIPDGDPNANPVVVAQLHNSECAPPATVNGDALDEAKAAGTHVLVTPHGVDQQVGGDRRVSAPNQELTAETLFGIRSPKIELGTPTDPAVLGNQLLSQLGALVTALNVYAATLGPPGAPPGSVTIAVAQGAASTLATALGNFQTGLQAVLSQVTTLE